MDLVRDDDEVVARADLGEAGQFGALPEPAAGIVRRAARGRLASAGVMAASRRSQSKTQRAPSRPSSAVCKRGVHRPRARQERRVDRRARQHALAGGGQSPAGDAQAGHQPGQPDQVGLGDGPGELPLQAGKHHLDQLPRRLAVAEDPVSRPFPQRRQHRRRRGEVRVGHPQRNDVAALVPIPLDARGAATIDGPVEIEGR